MKVLALDLAIRTGWAVGEHGQAPRFGVWALSGPLGERLSCLAAALEEAIERERPDLIFVEAPLPPQAHTHMASARSLFGLAAVVDMIAHEQGIECEEEGAMHIRGEMLGKARPDKDAVVAWCRNKGWKVSDHNAADALVCLAYILKFHEGRVIA